MMSQSKTYTCAKCASTHLVHNGKNRVVGFPQKWAYPVHMDGWKRMNRLSYQPVFHYVYNQEIVYERVQRRSRTAS